MKVFKKQNGTEQKKGRFTPLSGLSSLLFNDDVYKRIGGFLLLGLIILLVFWGISQLFLKNGLLDKTFLVDKLFGIKGSTAFENWGVNWLGESFSLFKWEFQTADTFRTWGNVFFVTVKNLAHHLVVALVFILFLNRFKIRRMSLGMIFFLIYTALSGILVGTNSIPYPAQTNNIFGPIITFLRYGVWVWFAYGLLTVSTQQWTWLKSGSLLDSHWEKTGKFWPLPKLTSDEKEVYLFGWLFLLAASFAEARLIVFYGRHLF